MDCEKPITLWKRGAQGNRYPLYVPCGKCIACMERRRNEWSVRMYLEYLSCERKAIFVTLTYNEENIPFIDGKPTLCKKDVQNFLKRLRKIYKFRYYLCGEYGPKTHRPHYHLILFGLTPTTQVKLDINNKWSVYDRKNKVYRPIGFTVVRQADYTNIHYTAKYMLSKLFDDWQPPTKEFCLSSTNEGIGAGYCRISAYRSFHIDGKRDFIQTEGGYKHNLPKYILERLFSDTDLLDIKYKREQDRIDRHDTEIQRLRKLYKISDDLLQRVEDGNISGIEEYNQIADTINYIVHQQRESYNRKKIKQISKSCKL